VVTSAAHWARTLDALRAVLTAEQSVEALLAQRRTSARSSPETTLPRVSISNELSDDYTVIEVKCPDRLGLLYLVTRTLSALELDIASARIATEIDQAFDTFYVHDTKGRKIENPAVTDGVRAALEAALVQPL
jgi:[protein-PII] uridylyltransferase